MIRGTLADVADALKGADDCVICGHVSPDGDCIGSQLALACALRSLGKRVICELAGDEEIPFGLKTLPGAESLVPSSAITGAIPTFITVDVPTTQRMGEGAAHHARAQRTISIDHHPLCEPLSQVNYVDAHAPACAMIIWKLLPYLGVTPNKDIATCCFTGLSTDTGSFRFQNATSEAFLLASEMVAHGADAARIATDVYQNRSQASLALEAIMVSRLRISLAGQLAFSYITKADFDCTGANKADAETLIETLRSVRGVRVACLLRAQEDGVRGSLRAKDETDVSGIAARLGGGGHRAAAGFTFSGTLTEAIGAVETEFGKLFA